MRNKTFLAEQTTVEIVIHNVDFYISNGQVVWQNGKFDGKRYTDLEDFLCQTKGYRKATTRNGDMIEPVGNNLVVNEIYPASI